MSATVNLAELSPETLAEPQGSTALAIIERGEITSSVCQMSTPSTTGLWSQSKSTVQATVMSATIQELETRLEELHGQIHINQIEAGRIISELRKSFKRGEWMPYSQKLYRRLAIASKTAYRYVEAFEQSQTLGAPICEAAVRAGLNLNKVAVRETLIETKKAHPEASPDKIVKMTNLALSRTKPTPVPVSASFNSADFRAAVTECRSEFSKLNQFTKNVQRGDGDRLEAESIISSLRDLAKDAADRADRLAAALDSSVSEAA